MSDAIKRRHGHLYDGWAPFYDLLLGEAGFAHIWSSFQRACRRFGISFATAADFGCGTGLFLAALARSAPHATLFGVDRSAGMLRVAMQGLAQHKVRLYQGDLRSIQLPQPVDLVTCNFSTVNYLLTSDALQSAIINFARHLRSCGHLVLDFLCGGGPAAKQQILQRIMLPGMVASWHIRSGAGNTGGTVVMKNCRREVQGWRCWQETHDQHWWRLSAMLHRLRAAGLLPLVVAPLGEVSTSRGGRWIQVVAQRM